MKVIDLFCGMGGMSYGFNANGFNVEGYDVNQNSPEIFRSNNIGKAVVANLGSATIERPYGLSVITGGPPCKPWSVLNRSEARLRVNVNYTYLQRFFDYVYLLQPDVFLMENVTPISKDLQLIGLKSRLYHKYSMRSGNVSYSDYGAATKRRRYFLVGFNFRHGMNRGKEFFERLKAYRRPAKTVLEAIGHLQNAPFGMLPDHEWLDRTISESDWNKIRNNKFGYTHLRYDEPAPSFGNISKIHVLHPLAGQDGFPLRSISVKEAMNILGFPDSFRLPDMGMVSKYQMVADAVSPMFSTVAAKVIRDMLWA